MNSIIVVVFLVVFLVINAEKTVGEKNRHENEITGKSVTVLDKSQLLDIRSAMAKLKSKAVKGNENKGINILENLLRSLNGSAIPRSNIEDTTNNANSPMKNDSKYVPNTENKENNGFGSIIDTKGRSGIFHRGQLLHLPLRSNNKLNIFRNVGHPRSISPKIFNKMNHYHDPVYMHRSIPESRRTKVEEEFFVQDSTGKESAMMSEEYLDDSNSYKFYVEKK